MISWDVYLHIGSATNMAHQAYRMAFFGAFVILFCVVFAEEERTVRTVSDTIFAKVCSPIREFDNVDA